ncbi:hypothetical protein [Ramlibacter sp.]|uniref:hypothetical protein n=1 Tax=Ramlibacter sp. TaxID=1917967 RepID=UPI003D0EA879
MQVDAVIAGLIAGREDELARLEAGFAAMSERALAHGSDGAAAHAGIDAGQVAVRIGIARKALATASAYDGEAREINRALARANLLDAVAAVARLAPSALGGAGEALNEGPAAPAPLPKGEGARPDVLLNICRHHREHERFYVQDRTTVAADLHREATKLKIVADAWQRKPAHTPDASIDWAEPTYAPAGCPDLNELNAIGMIGVLFMEGDGEPIEIKVLKSRLAALAAAWRRAGEWLAAKMEAAWDREQAMYRPASIAVARQRFNTIVMNWRGSRERLLAARTLEMALRVLESIPFEPKKIREDRANLGRRLDEAGEMIAAAAQLVQRTAADLADNDRNWTDCIRHLEHAGTRG